MQAAARIASYYSDQFDNTLATPRNIYLSLQEKSYGQEYIERFVKPDETLRRHQQSVREHFNEICQWTLLYELIRRPLLGRTEQLSTAYRVKEVIKKFLPAAVNSGIEMALASSGAPVGASAFLQTIIQPLTDPAPTPTRQLAAPPAARGEVDIAAQEHQFIRSLDTALVSGQPGKVEEMILEQFSALFRAAVTAALPFIEDLFFFEVGRYRRVFESVAADMLKEHLEHLSGGDGGDGGVRQVLMENNPGPWREVSAATDTLRALKALG
jgi:hypothetical protein